VLDLDRHVPYFFTFISNRLSRGASDTYRSHFGIGITEWRVMGVLADMPGVTANQIITAIGLDKAAVSRSLRELERQRLVVGEPDPDDNRARIIRLSKAGDDLHDRVVGAALAREKRLLAALSPSEHETLIVCLRKLKAAVGHANAYEPTDAPVAGRRR
jgi:DNA-binding MarR family transcriptional regulator